MGLLSVVRTEKRTDSLNGSTGIHPRDPALADLWGGRNSASGQNVTSDTALRISTVFACVTVLSQTLAMLPKLVRQRRDDGGHDILWNHRLFELFANSPSRWQDDFEWTQVMEGHRNLRGNAYAKIVPTPGRGLNELVMMHPDRVWPFVITPNQTTYFMYDFSPPPAAGSKLYYQHFPLDGETEILTADEVLHLKGYSVNGIVGINPIRQAAGREAVGLAMAAQEQSSRLFSNGAKMQAAVKYPGKVDDITYNRMKKDMTERLSSSDSQNWFRPFFLEEGMDIVKLSMSSVDAQLLEITKFSVEDIARMFNVPLALIGHGDKAPTYKSIEQFFLSFKSHTMQPNIARWEKGLKRQLLYTSEKKVEFYYDIDAMLRADVISRSTYLKNRFGMASITPDEVRVYEGENRSGQKGADKLYVLQQMIPLEKAGMEMTSKTGTGETIETDVAQGGNDT